MDEKILTQHPANHKNGVWICKAKYELLRNTITQTIGIRGELTFTELARAVNAKLGDEFDDSISWYIAVVKLDLEARRVIRRVPRTSPTKLQLAII